MLSDELKALADDFRKHDKERFLNNLHDLVISVCRGNAERGYYYSEVNIGEPKEEVRNDLVKMLKGDGFEVGEPRYIYSASTYVVRVIWGEIK